jgi:hypothetical protein
MFELDHNDHHRKKLGYYQVGNQCFTNKYMALNHSSQSDNFHFDFNNDVFSNCNWSQEPSDDLYEIYRKRAQQLRDRYDNLVLYFSGGVDSTVILMTFLVVALPHVSFLSSTQSIFFHTIFFFFDIKQKSKVLNS